MRQILLKAPGEFLERQVPQPAAAAGEALVRIRRVGICGSDLRAFSGEHPAYTYPRILGHELAGEIVDIPTNNRGLKKGDSCAIEPYLSCGACRPCRLGRSNCCEHLCLLGVHVDGGMQGFLSVPLPLLHRSNAVSLDQLALVETLGIGAHAVARSGLTGAEEALVIGAGPVGLAVVQFAQAVGAVVRVVEAIEWRRRFAGELGVDVLSRPDGRLSDVVFDATGNAASMSASVRWVAPTGRLVFVGLTKEPVSLDDALLHKREITVLASRNSCGKFPRIIQMLAQGTIDTSRWITHRFPLAEVPARLEELPSTPGLVKAIVDVDEADA